VLVTGGCSKDDTNKPLVVTRTVNGVVTVITTGP
jgi:hypothetical protein